MIKTKYRPALARLQNLKNPEYNHAELSELFGKYGLKVSANALSNRYLNDGYLNKIEVDIIYQEYGINLLEDENDCIDLPVLGDVEASCGHGVTVCSETQTSTYAIGRKLANDLGISINESQMIFAKGDSMSPVIEGGDGLLVDTSKKDVYDGSIYCVRIEGQLYAKRLQKIPPQTIKVVSDNKEKYDPFYVDLSKKIDFDFEIIGEVKWWGRVAR